MIVCHMKWSGVAGGAKVGSYAKSLAYDTVSETLVEKAVKTQENRLARGLGMAIVGHIHKPESIRYRSWTHDENFY